MADFGARAGAFIADIVLFFALSGFVSLFVRVLATTSPSAGVAFTWLPILGGLAPFVFFWGRAQSPGKAALGLQVVDRDGRPTQMGRMLVRAVLLKGVVVGILAFTFFGPIVWYLWPLWDKERRAPHDMILGTHVVRKGRRQLSEA